MSERINSTGLKSEGWRAILPRRWPVLLIHVVTLISLQGATDFAASTGRWKYYYFFESCSWNAFSVLFALVAMLRIPVRHRLVIFLFLELLRVILPLIRWARELPTSPSLVWTEVILGLRANLAFDVVDFAFVAVFAHCASSLLGAFVSPRIPDRVVLERGAQGGVAEWIYLILLIRLIFVPRPTIETHRGPIVWQPIGFESILSMIQSAKWLCVPLTGLFILASLRCWRFGLAMFACIIAVAMADLNQSGEWDHPRGLVMTICRFALFAFTSAPFWLILRAAGYRLYSPRGWIYTPGVLTGKTSDGVAP